MTNWAVQVAISGVRNRFEVWLSPSTCTRPQVEMWTM